MIQTTNSKIAIVIALISVLALNLQPSRAQIFDQLFRNVRASPQDEVNNGETGVRLNDQTRQMGIKIPMFYDMTRNGNNFGINVLSGLVKVERGEHATRSGLNGPNPLSVRIFGIPVYERGTRNYGSDANYQPDYEMPANVRPVPEGPDGPVDPSG